MAITRTQIAKQLLAQGGRTGFQGGGADLGTASSRDFGFGDRDPRDNREIGARMDRTRSLSKDQIKRARDFRDTQKVKDAFTKKTFMDKIPSGLRVLSGISKFNPKFIKEFAASNPDLLDYINSLDETDQSSAKLASALKEIGYGDFLADVKGAPGLKFAGNVGGLGTKSAVRDIDGNIIGFKYDEPRDDRGDPNILFPQGIMTQAPSITEPEPEEEDEGLRLAFRANGGRIGFQGGGKDLGTASSRDFGFGDRDARDDAAINRRMQNIGAGGGGGSKGPDTTLKFKKDIPDNFAKKLNIGDFINLGLIDDEQENMKVAGLNQEQVDYLNQVGKKVSKVDATGDFFTYDSPANVKSQLEKLNPESESGIFSKEFDPDKIVAGDPNTYATEKDVQDYIKSAFPNLTTGGRKVGLAEGGMPYEGGIMDLESARQMYGLGKLVKKVTRTVKKIAKSPIGKAAIAYGIGFGIPGTSFGGLLGTAKGSMFGAREGLFGTFGPTSALKKLGLMKSVTDAGAAATRVGPLANLGIGSAILGVSALAGLLTPKQEEEAQQLSRGEGIDIEAARRMILQAGTSGDQRGLAFRAEGGPAEGKEPVAKKTMPLLDMGGKEMDLREDGGFVPIGRMEKADDVPARLSKNEFVFTADAVRNAGDGDVDKGAEVMYNMMKNLEAGGDVSEESQGLEGARKMFQTSQRLEEVL